MKATEELIEDFRSFALERLRRGADLSVDELYDCWRQENSDENQAREDLLAVKASLQDMDRGERGQPFDEFARDFRARHSLGLCYATSSIT